MENILKRLNSKWFLLFLFTFFSLGMQAQWDENKIDWEVMDKIIEDDGSWDDYAPLDQITELDEVVIINDHHDDDPFMDFPEDEDWGFPDDEPLDLPNDELPPKEFTSSLEPKDCIIVCSGYSQRVPNECRCEATARPWYPDNDGDDWHNNKDLPIINAINSPGYNYKNKTLGADCDDNNLTITNECYKNFYLDNDGDDWHSGIAYAVKNPGGNYKETTNGLDCDDILPNGILVQNDCTKIAWVKDVDDDKFYVEGSERQEYINWQPLAGFKKKENRISGDCDDNNINVNKKNKY